ncbi:Glycosyltransferase involved in cell wall bisynthesis [Lutibacter agarilyticus]|uniref:Glycosyltransferase involved in cell wall bisynthesis n=1 Tax=Lutibacter agarilyticus TaxID=1109740 RepID=A0A238YXB3_9FLAO|nr:glycosyltransferase [Lutibacter agarilyticus]SNR75720.1 Glycosyltransferase involved in cell wall bisynthesis [Lutibacter agarilyticus]
MYIGNHLTSANPTTLDLLSKLLMSSGFQVKIYSNQQYKLLRLLHMCWGVITNTNANYVLIDTYSTVNFYYALVISQLARLFSISYIPILHGGNLPERLKTNPKLCSFIFKHSLVTIAPSNYLQVEFQQKGFKTQFIPNAIELKNYPFKQRTVLAPNLLWVRAFDAIYNPTMAIEVLEILKTTYPNATLCMVGADKDGSLEKVIQFAEEKGLLNSIEFTGYLSKEEWIEKSKNYAIFMNTTTIDNTPVSVLEAMALGLPVVSTNVGGLPYLIQEDITGCLVAAGDAAAMAFKIGILLQQPKKAIEISQNARTMVEDFDVTKVKEQWIQLLT